MISRMVTPRRIKSKLRQIRMRVTLVKSGCLYQIGRDYTARSARRKFVTSTAHPRVAASHAALGILGAIRKCATIDSRPEQGNISHQPVIALALLDVDLDFVRRDADVLRNNGDDLVLHLLQL